MFPAVISHSKWNQQTHDWNQQMTTVPLKKKPKMVRDSKQFWCPISGILSSFFTVGQVAICWFQFWCG
jgi:hypothetical protein